MSYVMVGAAAAGLLKSQLIDRQKEDRDRKLAAETQRLSPWTGLKAGPIKEADPVGSTLAFGATGMQGKANMEQQELNKKLAEKALNQTYTPVNVNMGGGPGRMDPGYWYTQLNNPLGSGMGS
jgi:hypothetical protein